MAGAAEILVSGGVAAVLAAVAGGGLKAFGVELPLLATVKRQLLVMVVGVGLIGLGLASGSLFSKGPDKTGAIAPPGVGSPKGTGAAAEPAGSEAERPAAGARSDRPDVPNIVEMEFPAARRFLMQNGWAPIYSAVTPLAADESLGFRGEEIYNAGFGEAVSCSGTGMGPCLFRYRNPRGYILQVVTIGEDVEQARVNGVTLIDCSERPKPEAC